MNCIMNFNGYFPSFWSQMSSLHSEDDIFASQMAEKKTTKRRKRNNRSRSSGSSDGSPERGHSRSRSPSPSKNRSSRGGRKDSDEIDAVKLAELLNKASKIVEYMSVSKLEINKKYIVESLKIYNNHGNDFGNGLQAILTDGDKKIKTFLPKRIINDGAFNTIKKTLKSINSGKAKMAIIYKGQIGAANSIQWLPM
jgi:hypothetical protein